MAIFARKPKDPLEIVAEFEDQIFFAGQDVKNAENAVANAELQVSDHDSPEAQSALKEAYSTLAEANNRLIGKNRALVAAKERYQNALREKENLTIAEDWIKTASLGRQILERSRKFEELQTEATKEFSEIIDLTRKAMALVPRTDGTRPFDSLLSDGALVNYFRLEVNRNDLRVFAREYSGHKTQQQFYNNLREGLGWLFKLAPPDVKGSGDWVK